MTDDIVARLREKAKKLEWLKEMGGTDRYFVALISDAADEIERLRAALLEAREDILLRHNARGSEAAGTDEEAVSFIDAALAGRKKDD